MNLLESLGQGLRGVGGILDEGVYKGQRQEDQLMQQMMEKRRDMIAQQTIKAAESGSMDPEQAASTLQRLGYQGMKVGPDANTQERQERVKNELNFRKEIAAAGEDMTKIATAAAKWGKPEIAVSIYNAQETKQANLTRSSEMIEMRKTQIEGAHEARMASIKGTAERAEESARHNKVMEALGAQAQQIQLQIASGNQQLRALQISATRESQQTNAEIRKQREEDRREDRANKPLNEGQGRAVNFGTRAARAHDVLNSLEDQISTTGLAAKQAAQRLPGVGGALGVIGNVALSADQQRVEQAQRDFVNANLRQESGAVISESEFENARKQYFPQPGDSKEVIAQKKRNRETAVSGFKRQAGRGSTFIDEDRESASALLPKPKGSIRDQADAILGR